MGARVLAIVVEIFVGLVLAGVVVGAVVPFAHGTMWAAGAPRSLAVALVVVTVILRRGAPAPNRTSLMAASGDPSGGIRSGTTGGAGGIGRCLR